MLLLPLLLLPSSRMGGMRGTILWREARRLCIDVEVDVDEEEGEVGPLAMSAAGGRVMGDGERGRLVGVVGEGVDDLVVVVAAVVVGIVTTVLVIFVGAVSDSGAGAIVIASSAVIVAIVFVVVVVPSASILSRPVDETGLVGDADLDDEESDGEGGEGEGEAIASMPMTSSPAEGLPPLASCMVFVTLVILV